MQTEQKTKDSQSIAAKRNAGGANDLSIIQISTVAYLLMGAAGALISLYGHSNFWAITIPGPDDDWIYLIGVAALSTGVLLIGGYLFEGWFPSYRSIKRSITQMLGPTAWYTAIYLALLSSVGEELLFRAALLPYTGLLISSIIFGLVHIGPDGGISTWTFWAFCAGLLIGWMFEATGSLWPCIICHFSVNAFSLLRIQRDYRREFKNRPPPEEQAES